MRKTSQDGGDATSITSGVENEIKKPGGILKTKRNSIKRKVQSLSHESDDAVIEPLLQKDKEDKVKTDVSNQSAKYDLLSKTKTDATSEKGNDKEKLLQGKIPNSGVSDARNVTDTMPSSIQLPKTTGVSAPLHNHMNTNVFSSHDALKGLTTPKTQILVEVNGSKQTGYNPSPLIFTTAKIHTDGKTKHMEPLQVTPVPILSTIEVSVLKGTNISSGESSGVVTSNISPMYTNIPKNNVKSNQMKSTLPTVMTTDSSKIVDNKALNTSGKSLSSAKDKVLTDIYEPKIADSLKDKVKAENKTVNNESIKDRNEKQTKLSISQPIISSSSVELKTAVSGSSKPATTASNTKIDSGTFTSRESTRGVLDQTKKKDNIDARKSTAQKTDLNKNIKSIDSSELSYSEVLNNKSDSTGKDKNSMVGISTSNKQLQRQKEAIDKDDPTSKSGLTNESKHTKRSTESEPCTEKNITQIKPAASNTSRLAEKSKLPISAANNIQITSHVTTPNIKPPSVSNIVSTAANKTITSNSTSPVSRTSVTKVTGTTIISSTTQTSSIAKSLSNNVTTTGNNVKSTDISKPQTTRAATSTHSSSAIPSTNTVNISAVEAPLTTSHSTTNIKSPAVQIDTKASATKVVPHASATKSTSSVKSPPESANSTNNPPLLTSSVKSQPVSTNIVKTSPASISTTKATPVLANTVKSSPGTTSITKAPPGSSTTAKHTTTAKSPSISSSISKNPTASGSNATSSPGTANTVKKTSVSASTVKSTPVTTNNAKSSSTTTNTAKPSTTKSNIAQVSKVDIASPAVKACTTVAAGATVSTVTTAVSTVPTSNSAVSNKITDAKSTELSNGNKSLKA